MTTEPLLSHTPVSASPSPERWLYLIHGIYGSGRNWATFARRLVEQRPEWGVILLDLRLHGASTGFSPPNTVASCTADIARLEQHLGLPATALLGHSFGGKVALLRAAEVGSAGVQAWIIDSGIEVAEPSGSAWDVIGIVRSLGDTFGSRDELESVMAAHGYQRGLGHWLAMNLEREGDRFRWKLDWNGVEAMLRDYFATDVWPIIENPPPEMEIHVVKAEGSSAMDEKTVERLLRAGERTGRVFVHTVAGGHWVNVDNPEAVLELLTQHLP